MKQARDTWLYFIATEDYRHVKIGVSLTEKGCFKRLESCQTGNHQKLYMAAVIPPWNHHGEGYTHRLFAEHRVRGEWFVLTDEIWAYAQRNGQRTTDTAFVVNANGDVNGAPRGPLTTNAWQQVVTA